MLWHHYRCVLIINICEWKPYILNPFSWFLCLKGYHWLAKVFVYSLIILDYLTFRLRYPIEVISYGWYLLICTYLNMLFTWQVRVVAALAPALQMFQTKVPFMAPSMKVKICSMRHLILPSMKECPLLSWVRSELVEEGVNSARLAYNVLYMPHSWLRRCVTLIVQQTS